MGDMKKFYSSHLAIISLLLISFIISPDFRTQTLTAEIIYKKVSDAVVVIYAYDSNNQLSKQGSGVVINDKGYIVTNYHVLSGNDRIEVLHNKEVVPYVDMIGIDVEKDILILKIDEKKFPAIKIGDSKSLNIGQRVYAIGSPLGFENTISEGIISGLRNYVETGKNFIQITASISPGSSGGAIVNDEGELIGISTSTAEKGQNLNFAIPIDEVLSVEIDSYSQNNAYKNFEWFSKGYDAAKKGNYQDAIKYFTSYIKEFPNKGPAYNNRGFAKENLGDYKVAIQDFNRAIEINPNYADAYINRGVAKSDLEDSRGAILDYSKAIEINPGDGLAYFNRGTIKIKLEDYTGAMLDFDEAINLDPNYFDAHNSRGFVKVNLNDYEGAIQDFKKAMEIRPLDESSYYNCGYVYLKLKEYKGAIINFNTAIAINPDYIDAYINRGIAKILLGDKIGGCLDWSKAGELGDDTAYDLIKKNCN